MENNHNLQHGAGTVAPPSYEAAIVANLKGGVKKDVKQILNAEQNENPAPAYVQMSVLAQQVPNSIAQETSKLYDKTFYKPSEVVLDAHGNARVEIDCANGGLVRLNDKIETVPELSTVNDIRNRVVEGTLISGVGALKVFIKDSNGQATEMYAMIQRDGGAPVDPYKWTLPAGRGDKTSMHVVNEEIMEELRIFGKKDGKWYMVNLIPFDGSTSAKKSELLGEIARGKYIESVLKSENGDKAWALEAWNAPCVDVPMHTPAGGKSVTTNIKLPDGTQYSTTEQGFYPLYDEKANTWEIAGKRETDLTGFDEIRLGDGDGFGRVVQLFTPAEMARLAEAGECTFAVTEIVKMIQKEQAN